MVVTTPESWPSNWALKLQVAVLAAVVVVLVRGLEGIIGDKGAPANGFGEHLNWKAWPDSLAVGEELRLPSMVVVHRAGCPACEALKPKFAASQAISDLSSRFVMVNGFDLQDPRLEVDGGYVPRIMFLDPKGRVMREVFNKGGNENYKYFHHEPATILEAMREALSILNRSAEEEGSSNDEL